MRLTTLGIFSILFLETLAAFKDHKPRRPHRRPNAPTRPPKIPLEDKFERRERLIREKRRKTQAKNERRNRARENPEGYNSRMLTSYKDKQTGKVYSNKHDQKAVKKRFRTELLELYRKREEQWQKFQDKAEELHYATRPFHGKRGQHVIYIQQGEKYSLKDYKESWVPTVSNKDVQRKQALSYKELSRYKRNVDKLDRRIAKIRLKLYLMAGGKIEKVIEHGKKHYKFLAPARQKPKGKPKTVYTSHVSGLGDVVEKLSVSSKEVRAEQRDHNFLYGSSFVGRPLSLPAREYIANADGFARGEGDGDDD